MRENSLPMSFFGFKRTFVSLFFSLAILLLSNNFVQASTKTLTSQADWQSGNLSELDSKSVAGDLKLNPAGSWGARNWRSPDLTLSVGSSYTSDGTNIYVIRGVGDTFFSRYSPESDQWTNLASLPYGTYYGADLLYLDGYVYAIFGGQQTAFARYSVADNSWEMLPDTPDFVHEGASLTTDGTNIYMLRGYYSRDFYKFDLAQQKWQSLANTPHNVRRGSDLVYLNGYIYATRGYNDYRFYRYDISANSWSSMANTPQRMYDETDLTTDGTYIYAVRGYGQKQFFRYNPTTNSWQNLPNTPQTVRYGGVVYNSSDGMVYVFRASNTYHFWKFNPNELEFIGPTDAPSTFNTGADLLYHDGYLYAPRGYGQSTFWRYKLADNTWETLANAPNTLYDDTKGVVIGDSIYLFRARGGSDFYRYDINSNTWTTLAPPPRTVGYGSSLVYPGSGDYIYATRGYNGRYFWRYSISGDSWQEMNNFPVDAEANYGARLISDGTDIYYLSGAGTGRWFKYNTDDSWIELKKPPFSPYYGTDITYYNGKFYALAGYHKKDFYEYDIAGDTWRKLKDLTGYGGQDIGPYGGGSVESDGNGHIYMIYGRNLSYLSVYTVDTHDFVTTGSWISNEIDLQYVSSWNGLSADADLPGDSQLSYETRTSSDGQNWSSWQTVNGSTINSPVARYIQVRVTFVASSDFKQTPTLHSLTIDYVGDVNPPTNPTQFSGKSQEIGGEDLTDGGSYRFIHPYFSWPQAGESGGANDSETSVVGYYVYFGPDNTADPETNGIFITTTGYQVAEISGTNTYYLRLKTKDAAGNVSAAITAFTYDYQGISPNQSLTINQSSQFNGEATDVSLVNDKIKLASQPGFWLEEHLAYAPAGMQYGAKSVAYVANTNKLYVFRGANTPTFYEYDINTNTWTPLANAPANVRIGGGVIEGSDGYLYGWAGNNTTHFWRYEIATDTWDDAAAADTPQTIYYGGSMVYDGHQFIYALRGNNDDSFWRYDTFSDTWETLAKTNFGATAQAVTNNVWVSGDLAIDTANQLIYATQGNYHEGFAVYDINTNEWSVLPDLPALPYHGSSIEYDHITNTIYYASGNNSPYVYKYDVGSSTWLQVSNAPSNFYYGSSMRRVGRAIYVLRGGNGREFYKYDIDKDSWLMPTVGLFGTRFRQSNSATEYYGADIVKGDGDNFYIIRGNWSDDFIRWNPKTGEIMRLANLPAGAYNGSALVYDSSQNKIYYTGSYMMQQFYVYDIANNTWSQEEQDPLPATTNYGASMVYDGSRYIYLARGGNSPYVYKFDTLGSPGSKWLPDPNNANNTYYTRAPVYFGYGSELTLVESNGHKYLYVLRGQNQNPNPFYRYDIDNNTWEDDPTDIQIDVYNDGWLTNGGDGHLYAVKGENTHNFYRYSLNDNIWTQLDDAPLRFYQGSAGEADGVNKIYAMPGSGSYSYRDGVYTYVMQTDSSSFKSKGSYTSQVHDLTQVYKWDNLRVVYEKPSNAGLVIKTRTSDDNNTWSNWALVADEKQSGNTYTYQIKSLPARYIQVKFELASADSINSPIIDSYTINYFQDTNPPTNPTNDGLTVYADASESATLVSDNWYAYESPKFDWPEAEATNGASDTSTGSGVAGYYVYFGTDANALATESGTLQTATEFTPTNMTPGTTYYFRLQTIDDAGNFSTDIWAPFVYKFDNNGPTKPANVEADPPGYTANNSFTFTWDEATASGALVSEYCYKTGTDSGTLASDQCISATQVNNIPAYKNGTNTFYVRAKDAAGNYSEYATTSYFYADPNDPSTKPAPPTNLTVNPTSSTENLFSFDWDPPPPGSYYGSEADLSYRFSVNVLPNANTTSVTKQTKLASGPFATVPGENVLYLVTQDVVGNVDYNNYVTVTFEANTTAPGVPVNIDVADVSVKATKSWKLALSWEAPPASGSGVDRYAVYRSVDGENFSKVAESKGISYVDVGLEQQTYYYKVKACDNTNNCGAFSEVVSMYPDGKYTVPAPLIGGPNVSNITTKNATVTWSTSRTCDSKVAFGTESGKYQDEEVSNSTHVTDHKIVLTNLSPGTTYYYVAKWTDEDGNTGISEEQTFTTLPPPSTKEPKVKSVGLDNALIQFTSANAAKVRIYYGESTAFGGTTEVVTGTAEGTHTVELTGLKDGTKYYYKISAFDIDGEEYEGEIHSFETLPRPRISKVKVSQVKGAAKPTLYITWETNTGVSSIITYYPSESPSLAQDEVNVALKKGKHQMILRNLAPETSYDLIIKGKDIAGNETRSKVITITTAADTRPPVITDLKVEGEIIGSGDEAKAQLLVSFNADEPTTAQVEYGEGSGSTYSQKTQEDTSLSMHHIVVISELTPSKVYHLRVLAKDKAGNLTKSIDKVVITPKATESALDLVITNLSEVFGFLGKK